jgi:hypothetical protein
MIEYQSSVRVLPATASNHCDCLWPHSLEFQMLQMHFAVTIEIGVVSCFHMKLASFSSWNDPSGEGRDSILNATGRDAVLPRSGFVQPVVGDRPFFGKISQSATVIPRCYAFSASNCSTSSRIVGILFWRYAFPRRPARCLPESHGKPKMPYEQQA